MNEAISAPMDVKCRIVVADDHTILREGLRSMLESQPGYEVVAVAEDGREAVRLVLLLKPDIAVMDLAMPRMDGMSAIRELKRRACETKVVVLTMHKSEQYMRAAFEAGASAYLLKESSCTELLMALESVMSGKTFISPAVADLVVRGYLDHDRKDGGVRSLSDTLTSREKQVLKLIAEGRRNREVAEFLFVSVKTVESHRANLMAKLDLHNAAALTSFAIENSLG
jgi:DNA-binding NarL/FixJ family response regulator